MEFANFEEFFKALDRLHEECVQLRRSIQQDREKASRSDGGKPKAGSSLDIAAAQLCNAAQRQLEITLAKERQRQALARSRSKKNRWRNPRGTHRQ